MKERPTVLPWPKKLGYGSAELGIVSVEVLIELYLLKFYNVVVGLTPGLAGLAIAVAIIWDAVSDPLMGEISDRTTHRHGRRRPYLIPGALALAAALVIIYNPPSLGDTTLKFFYLLGSYLALTTAMTIIGVPHIALGADLSFDRNERTEIFGYRRLFTTTGLLLGTMLPALVLRAIGSDDDPTGVARSRSITSFVLAFPILLTAWITYRSTRGLDHPAGTRGTGRPSIGRWVLSLFQSQIGALKNVVFLPLLLAFVVAGIGRALNASIALYYYEYRLGMTEPATVLYVLVPFFIAILASIPLWVIISKRAGKKWSAFWGILTLGILITVAYPLLPPHQLIWPLGVAIVGGFLAGAIILYESLVADVVDYDELHTRRNREGLFFGVWKMGTKLSRALGIAVAGLLLELIGFREGAANQTEEVSRALGVLFGPGVGVFFLIGTLLFAFMPLTDSRHRRVQALLLRRRQRLNRS